MSDTDNAHKVVDLVDSSSAAKTIDVSPNTIPPRNPSFAGRAVDLEWVREQLNTSGISAIASADGLGGTGKSTLAFEYAHQFASQYPGGRFLLPCEFVVDLRHAIVRNGTQFGVDLTTDERMSTPAAYRHFCTVLESRWRSLLILDNLDSAALLIPEQISLLPDRNHVHVIAITHLKHDEMPSLAVRSLGGLSEIDAVTLFEKHRPLVDRIEHEAVRSIVSLVNGYPIAVEAAAVYLSQHPEISDSVYLTNLEALASRSDVKSREYVEGMLGHILTATLASLTPPELLAIQYASLFPPDHVALPWLKVMVGSRYKTVLTPALTGNTDLWLQIERRLMDLRLLSPWLEEKVARIHQLVAEIVKTACSDAEIGALRRQLSNHAKQRNSALYESDWSEESRWELTVLERLGSQEMQSAYPDAAWNVEKAPLHADQPTSLMEASAIMMGAHAIEEKAWAADHPEYSQDILGMTKLLTGTLLQVTAQNDPKQALTASRDSAARQSVDVMPDDFMDIIQKGRQGYRTLIQSSIDKQEQASEPDYASLSQSYMALAMFEFSHGSTNQRIRKRDKTSGETEARALFLRAIALLDSATDIDDITRAGTYSRMAHVGRMIGSNVEASALLLRAISLREAKYGPTHPSIARDYASLAEIQEKLDNLEEARASIQSAIAIDAQVYTQDHAALVTNYSKLAAVETKLGNLAAARTLRERAIAILEMENARAESCPGTFSLDKMMTITRLATAYSDLAQIDKDGGDLIGAERILGKALAICLRWFGDAHPETKKVTSRLQSIRDLVGKKREAGGPGTIPHGSRRKGRRM